MPDGFWYGEARQGAAGSGSGAMWIGSAWQGSVVSVMARFGGLWQCLLRSVKTWYGAVGSGRVRRGVDTAIIKIHRGKLGLGVSRSGSPWSGLVF